MAWGRKGKETGKEGRMQGTERVQSTVEGQENWEEHIVLACAYLSQQQTKQMQTGGGGRRHVVIV